MDDPADWAARLPRLLAQCGSEARVLVTDCTEYPCVSAISWAEPNSARLDNCNFDSLLGATEWPALIPIPVNCPEGDETMWMVAVVDQSLFVELYPSTKGTFIPTELSLLGARRAEALAARWPCSEG